MTILVKDRAVDPVAIDCLDVLYAIREAPDLDYELQRDLDFNDDGSYCDVANRAAWTVGDFSNDSDLGWPPIPEFGGIFNGNGYAISNLQINRAGDEHIGLFGVISDNGVIYDLGLLNLRVEGNNRVGGIVGSNLGYIVGSYVVNTIGRDGSISDISGTRNAGGIAGANFGSILNSRALAAVNASDENAGGIAGTNAALGQIVNSYAIKGGSVRSQEDNSGGLVGSNGRFH